MRESFKDVFVYSQNTLFKREEDFLKGLAGFLEIEYVNSHKGSNIKSSNIGVRSILQVNTLIRLNKFNNTLERISPKLSLYSRVLRRLKLTPRNFCQFLLKNIKSKDFKMDDELVNFAKNYYQKDWNEVSKFISY